MPIHLTAVYVTPELWWQVVVKDSKFEVDEAVSISQQAIAAMRRRQNDIGWFVTSTLTSPAFSLASAKTPKFLYSCSTVAMSAICNSVANENVKQFRKNCTENTLNVRYRDGSYMSACVCCKKLPVNYVYSVMRRHYLEA